MDKLDLIVDRIEDLKESTDKRLDNIDSNLAEHMRRTDVLESLHRDNQQRIQLLEEPKKALLLIKNVVLYISVVTGGIIAILKVFGKV